MWYVIDKSALTVRQFGTKVVAETHVASEIAAGLNPLSNYLIFDGADAKALTAAVTAT